MTGPGLDVFMFGETMVSLRSAGPLAAGGALSMHVAGAESNVAVALARLGHRSGWGGRTGGDELGEFVLRRLRGEGVGTEDVVVDLERPTGLMFLEQRTADVARVQYHRARSAGSALSADDLRGPLTAGARVLHLTGITPALSGSAREATLWAAGTASAAGLPVCLDVNYRARLWPRDEARSVLAPLAAHASIVVASHDELDLVGPPGADEAAVVAGLRGGGTDTVLVKLGAAYLSGRLDGLDAVGCLRRAITLGAFAVSTRGDWEGLPRRDELSLLDGEAGSTIR